MEKSEKKKKKQKQTWAMFVQTSGKKISKIEKHFWRKSRGKVSTLCRERSELPATDPQIPRKQGECGRLVNICAVSFLSTQHKS